MYLYIFANNKQRARIGYNRTGPQTDADACSSTQKGKQDGGAAGSTRAFLGAARASRNLHERKVWSYGERKREKRPDSVRQHFVLPTRESLVLLISLLL